MAIEYDPSENPTTGIPFSNGQEEAGLINKKSEGGAYTNESVGEYATAVSAANNAKQSELNAAESETNAATSATNAASSATASANSATASADSASSSATSADNSATSETNAATSATNAANSATNASTSETNAATSESNAATSASNAATSETNASTSESNAATSEANAAISETNAANSASASASSATASETSASHAATSESNASTSEDNALASATAAANSASAAAASEANAQASAAAALASEQAAQSSEDDAETAQVAAESAQASAEAAETAAETAQVAAETAQTASETAQTAAESAQSSATASANSATASATSAASSAADAQSSEDDAETSATAAASSASAASSSASAASTSATAAATSATQAATSATSAATSATNASTSETNASTSETNAATSATNALASETAAATSETNAATSETNASTSATAAATSATEASTSASNASVSEANAATSETNAATSETNAGNSATASANSATAAAISATNAATSETNAATSETNAGISETNASTSETNAATSASSASASATAAASSASAASTSETNAAASESAAATSESNASTSETNAANSASAASASASAASTSETNAAASEAASEAVQETLYGIYLGLATEDPTVDLNGDALDGGEFYYNTDTNITRVYNGTSWVNGAVDTSSFVLTDSDASVNTLTVGQGDDGEGVISWDESREAMTVTMGNGVVLQMGEEIYYPKNTRNMTGYTIPNGTPVMLVGGAGDDSYIAPASALSVYNSEYYVGLTTEEIADGSYGRVTFFGSINDVDTSAFTKGDLLYVSTTAGQLTTTKPSSPDHSILAALVTKSHATEGRLFVRTHVNPEAYEINYDNTDSGLVASNVKTAIDELQDTKADIGLLSSNIILYPTTASSDVTGYNRMVTDLSDSDYDSTAVDVATGTISTDDQLVGALIADAGLFTGNPGVISIPTVGNIAKTSGNNEQYAGFYFTVSKRESNGTETLISTSSSTGAINPQDTDYRQFSASALFSNGDWLATDRVVIKYYAELLGHTGSAYNLQFGGSSPIYTNLPVPVSVIPSDLADDILVDTTNFSGVLSGTDSDVQTALETIDGLSLTIGGITGLQDELNQLDSDITAAISTASSDATTKANTAESNANAYTDSAVSGLVDAAPTTLDTLNELAAALGDDPNFATTVTNSIGTKAAKTTTVSAGTALTGGGDLSANRTISHANVTRSNTTDSGTLSHSGTFEAVTSVTTNAQGHVTGAETTTYTLPAGAVPNNATITISAGTDLTTGGNFTTDQGTNETITVNHSNISRTDTTSSASPSHGGTVDVVNSVSTNARGHVTGIDVKTITLPADNNTWRPIHDSPVNGATTTSISSNWAFDNVKTAVPSGAVFTDTVYSHPTHPGDDINLDTGALSGATVISDLDFNVTTDTLGHVTDANATYATRNITAADVGAAAASHSHSYVTEGGTSFSGTYPVAVRVSANNFYSDADITFNGTTSILNTTGGFTVGGSNTVFHDGYHPNADKWTTARTLSLTGDVTGSVSWDGSGNASLTATVVDDSHNHVIGNVDGLQTALDSKLNTVITYNTGSSSASYYKIRLPFSTSSAKMITFSISVMAGYQIERYEVSGYLYPSINQWYSPRVIYTGSTANPNIVVGRDSDGIAYVSLYCGSYAGISVHDVTIGYTGSVADTYNSNWSISSTSDRSNSVGVTLHKVWHSTNDGSGSGLDADTVDGLHASSFASASHSHDYVPERNRTDWNDSTVIDDVIGQMAWKNYGNNHTIFDASAGTAPGGTAKNNTNPDVAWTASYPTLMGWNGTNTFGVRVDSARYADYVGGVSVSSLLRSDADDTFSGALTSSSRNAGIFGTYDSTKTDQIWSMGTSYRNSSTGANFGNLYGLAYKHTNNTTGGTMASGHQMVWCQNGTPKSAVGTNIWTSGTLIESSDSRLKTDVHKIEDALNKVQQLNGYTFNKVNHEKRMTGVIAQEVLAVLPEAVNGEGTGEDDDYYSVSYGNMVGLLIEAIKEQQTQIDDLKAQVEALK